MRHKRVHKILINQSTPNLFELFKKMPPLRILLSFLPRFILYSFLPRFISKNWHRLKISHLFGKQY